MTAFDRDDLIRIALRPADSVVAPADLGGAIAALVAETPQRRSWLPRSIGRLVPGLSPTAVLAVIAALLLIIGAILAVASKRDAIRPELTMYRGGPARTGVMPGPGPAGTPLIAWEGDLRGPVPVQVMPIVRNGLVLVADGSGWLTAFGEADGSVRWAVDIGAEVASSPLVVGGDVVVGAADGSLTAFDLASRAVHWRVLPGGPINASLSAVDGIVYAGSDDGSLYAVDADSGVVVGAASLGTPVSRGPAIASGTIFIGSQGGAFEAVDLATRQPRWTRTFAGETGTPSVSGGLVYVPWGLDSDLPPGAAVALDTADGSQRWSFDSPSGQQVYVAAVADGSVYVVSKDGFAYGLDASTGVQRWSHDTGGAIGALAGLVDGVLYVTNDAHTVQAIDAASGEARWSIEVAGIPSMPAVIDRRVFVATSLGKVVAIEGSAAR